MNSSRIKRLFFASWLIAGCALYSACSSLMPDTQTLHEETPVANTTDEEKMPTDSPEPTPEPTPDESSAAQQDNPLVPEPESTPDTEEDADENKPIVFPVPTEAEGAELLQYENITFEPESKKLPDVAATVRSARKNKDASSMFITHMMYRDNIGDIAWYSEGKKQDTELTETERHREMIRWRDAANDINYELAILATNPSVQYEISMFYADDDEFKKGLNWLKKAAANGYGNAEYILGLVYFNGVGTKRDKKKGFQLLVRAAAHGVINAYYAVAMIYEMGLNGKKDTERSLYWLEKAAHFGSKDAIFILAMKYSDGIDVEEDYMKALDFEALDPRYHVWLKLIHAGFARQVCIYRFDESAVADVEVSYSGECGEINTSLTNTQGIDDEREDYTIEETADASLDYKIDYRIAAKWLKKVSNFDRDTSYILRAQTHHITGCRGELDGDKFDDIILYPDFDESFNYDNSDEYPTLFLKFIIALSDYDVKPSKLKKILLTKADENDRDALLIMGKLYENGVNENNDDDYDDEKYGYDILNENFGIKRNIKKAFEYYEKVFNIDEENCKKENTYCQYDRHAFRTATEIAETAVRKEKYDEAYEWYEKAFQFCIRSKLYSDAIDSATTLAKTANKNNNQDVAKLWYQKALDVAKSQYDESEKIQVELKKILDKLTYATKVAELAHSLGDDENAVKWYNISLKLHDSNTDKISWDKSSIHFALAQIYNSDTSPLHDDAKARELYKEVLKQNMCCMHAAAFLLCQNSYKTPQTKPLAFESCKLASEIERTGPSFLYNSQNDMEQKQFIQKVIDEMPKLDLQSEVEKQILAEKDKTPDNFFVIQKVLLPCKTKHDKYTDEEYYERGEHYSCSRINSFYHESIEKAITAITALSLAKSGTLNLNEIKNTYFFLAVHKGMDEKYREKLREDSAVYAAFYDGSYESICDDYLDEDEKTELFYIWYLRQIPHAAANIFKTLNSSTTWDEYLNEASELFQQNEQIHNTFGYDLVNLDLKLREPFSLHQELQ